MKKLGSLLMMVLALFGTAVTGVFAWFVAENSRNLDLGGSLRGAYFAGGDGSEADPYLITDARHLYNLAWLWQLNFFDGMTYPCFRVQRTAGTPLEPGDIDMTGMEIPPIGTDTKPFRGEFDGNGSVIRNTTVSSAARLSSGEIALGDSLGFFGTVAQRTELVQGANIHDFNLENIVVESAKPGSAVPDVGLVAGRASGDSLVNVGVYGGRIKVSTGTAASETSLVGKKLTGGTVTQGSDLVINPSDPEKAVSAGAEIKTLIKDPNAGYGYLSGPIRNVTVGDYDEGGPVGDSASSEPVKQPVPLEVEGASANVFDIRSVGGSYRLESFGFDTESRMYRDLSSISGAANLSKQHTLKTEAPLWTQNTNQIPAADQVPGKNPNLPQNGIYFVPVRDGRVYILGFMRFSYQFTYQIGLFKLIRDANSLPSTIDPVSIYQLSTKYTGQQAVPSRDSTMKYWNRGDGANPQDISTWPAVDFSAAADRNMAGFYIMFTADVTAGEEYLIGTNIYPYVSYFSYLILPVGTEGDRSAMAADFLSSAEQKVGDTAPDTAWPGFGAVLRMEMTQPAAVTVYFLRRVDTDGQERVFTWKTYTGAPPDDGVVKLTGSPLSGVGTGVDLTLLPPFV